jgi:hypothetical protein
MTLSKKLSGDIVNSAEGVSSSLEITTDDLSVAGSGSKGNFYN